MNIIFNADDRAWFKANDQPDRPLGKFFADLEAKLISSAVNALQPGDTDYQKGLHAGVREVLEIREHLKAPDTKDTGGEDR